MDKLTIDVQRAANAEPDAPHFIKIRSGETVFTQLLRNGQEQLDDYFYAPPAQLAFWLVDNWWRLRYECVPPGNAPAEWRLAHDLASIGGGYPWPRLSIWGEGARVGLASRSDPPGVVGPVRYLTDALFFIQASDFEHAVDTFLESATSMDDGFGSDRAALRASYEALLRERRESDISLWRRFEARAGFDPDGAPERFMQAIADLVQRHGEAGVEEAVQAFPGLCAASTLHDQIELTRTSGWDCDFSYAVRIVATLEHDTSQPPWKAAEEAGTRVRRALHVKSGLLGNDKLADLADISTNSLGDVQHTAINLEYGLRLQNPKNARSRLTFRSRWATGRRFELSRAIGDAIWNNSDPLGPLSRSKTARQKFQRAFAQALLCPFDELIAFMETSTPTDDDIHAAAQHFDVSDRVVRTTLVNKNVIERERIEDMVEAA